MVSIISLWLPILLSAVLVFIVSSIIHMMLQYHKNDFGKVPNEDEVRDALGKFNIPAGDYVIPCAENAQGTKSPEYIERAEKGPNLFMTVMPAGRPTMGLSLFLWFVYSVVVATFAAYIAGRALGPGAPYLSVFRFVGATTFIAYTVGMWQNSIWYRRAWSTTIKSTFDGLLYALGTAGVFGWLWPA